MDMENSNFLFILQNLSIDKQLEKIALKVYEGKRISSADAIYLYEKAPMNYLSLLATYVKEKKHGRKCFFNKNIHIEPTNICVYNCKFCSFRRKIGAPDAWNLSMEEILQIVEKFRNTDITEIHITGGVHPHYNLYNYAFLLKKIKEKLPHVHLKAFTAVEIDFMCRKANLSHEEGLMILKQAGLDSLPGGGAEIFNDKIRKQISHEKSSANLWLDIHRTAHLMGIHSNATMLYGHIENYYHRVEHMSILRSLQDETHGFKAFIPLKFKNSNNQLSNVEESIIIQDMRNFAVARIFLDNFDHLKFYWVNFGRKYIQIALNYGVDDIDGTINNTTKIYSMAGSEEQSPSLSESEMIDIINSANLIACERDSNYKVIKQHFPVNEVCI